MTAEAWGERIRDALSAACHPPALASTSVSSMTMAGLLAPLRMSNIMPLRAPVETATPGVSGAISDVNALVVTLFAQEGRSLVRLARLFVDDRNAAEDLVQEAFIRLARSAHRIQDETKAAAYLRSIVLNLARDSNRKGLVSLRHHLPFELEQPSVEDEIELHESQREVIDALRELPQRQRNALVLRYYEEMGIDEIADAMGISRNSVKTHLQRGLAALERHLGATPAAKVEVEAEGIGG